MPQRVKGFSFEEAYDLAFRAVRGPWGEGGNAGHLGDYIAAVPLTANQRQLLADLLRMLPVHLPRGAHGERKHTNNTAAKRTARQAIPKLKTWCEQNRRQRVPPDVKKRIILGIDSTADVDQVLLLLKIPQRL